MQASGRGRRSGGRPQPAWWPPGRAENREEKKLEQVRPYTWPIHCPWDGDGASGWLGDWLGGWEISQWNSLGHLFLGGWMWVKIEG